MDPVQATQSQGGEAAAGGEGDMGNVSKEKQLMSKLFTATINKLLDEARTNANNGA